MDMLCLLVFLAFINVAELCYNYPNSASFKDSLHPLGPNGFAGHYSGYGSSDTDKGISFEVWLLSYDSSTSKSFYLSLVARSIRNPSNLLILWTANRNHPVNHEMAILEFGQDGNLMLLDDGGVAWETDTANKRVVFMCIEYRGIVLRTASGDIVWKSIDEPTDTLQMQTAFFPGNKLVSRISQKNFSSGPYSFVMEKNGLALYFNSQPYWIFSFSGENNAESVVSEANSEKIYSALCWQSDGTITLDLRTNLSQIGDVNIVDNHECENPSSNDQGMQLPVNGGSFTYATFLRLTDLGDIALYSWDKQHEQWPVYYRFSHLFNCFLPDQCGAYRVCDKETNTCSGSCPSTGGFSLDNGNCKLEEAEACSPENDTFVEVPGSDYFTTKFVSPHNWSKEECLRSCKLDCSCKAAFYKEENVCFQTHADVQSLETGNYLALLRVANSSKATVANPRKSKDRNETRALGISLGILLSVLVLGGCLAWTLCKTNGCLAWTLRKTNEHFKEDEEIVLELSRRANMPKRYTYHELQEITSDFSQCLGNGGFGSVYVGKMPDGEQVAVKKLEGSDQRSRDFFAEVAVLAKTHHWNLVKLLGFCAEGPSRRLLIYEYMVHGSLEKWIFQPQHEESSLPWKVRFDIALGTARGLSYLHEQCDEKIVHLDLKPENVLLDNGLQPKIADFGLSRLMSRDESYLQMTTIRGTPGYVAPEILQEGTVTEKSDVYSFGVLLLEIISGYRNKYMLTSYLIFQPDRRDILNNGREEKRLRTIAFLCIQDDPDARPSMSKVIQMMEGLVEVPDDPAQLQLHFFLSNKLKEVETFRNAQSKISSIASTSENTTSMFFNSSL